MSFEQLTTISFSYNGELVRYSIQQAEKNGWIVSCSHPIFTERFKGASFNNSLGELISYVKFEDCDYGFFKAMEKAFRTHPFED